MNPTRSPHATRHSAGTLRRAFAWATGCAMAALVPLVAPGAASAFGTFGPVESHSVSGFVSHAAARDLDGNGTVDIAASNQASTNGDSLLVYFGNGDGTLAVPIPLGVGEEPSGIAIGRFDRDRRPDIAVANHADDTISFISWRKVGGFKHGPTLDTPHGPYLLAAADLNRDRRTDLVGINDLDPGPKGLSVWLQRRRGGLGPRKDYRVPGGVYGLAVGRLDADKRPDVATLNSDGDILVRLARRDGRLGRARLTHNPLTGSFYNMAVADLNRDGKGDVAVGDDVGGELRVRLGRGNGRFRSPETINVPDLFAGLAAGDFDRDGKLDLAAGSYPPAGAVVVRGKGNGRFAAPSPAYPAGSLPFSLGTARLNADRGLDLILGGSDSLDIFLNQP